MDSAGLAVGGLRLHFHLHLVESLAVDAVDIGLRDESVVVDALDDAKDRDGLVFAAHAQQHFHFLLAVPSHAGDDGAPAVGLVVDGGGNLAPVA